MSDEEIRITLRLPQGVRDRLANAGRHSGRSLNSEIVQRLEDSFSSWPPIRWKSRDLMVIHALPNTKINELEKDIQKYALSLYKSKVRNSILAVNEMREAFEYLISAAPDDEKTRLEAEFKAFLGRVGVPEDTDEIDE